MASLSGVEAEPQAIEAAQPEVAPALISVGLRERAAGGLDPGPGEGLRRERERLGAHQLQSGALGIGPLEEVEHHLGSEARGADPEPCVAQGVRRAPAERRTEEGAEAGAGVDGTAPVVAEAQPLE